MSLIFFKKRVVSQHGFTLIEVMVSLVIFLIAIIGCYRLQFASSFSNGQSNSRANASRLAQDIAENLLSRQYANTPFYTDPALIDTNGNGFGGVDAATTGTADGYCCVYASGSMACTLDGAAAPVPAATDFYRVYWNIVDDRPLRSIKQVRVIVVKNGGLNAGTLYTQDYFKRQHL